ncbi:MAG: hypothetical protein ACI94Y_001750 [Maribacter sp.]|jgi:hypothetical protein
MTDKITITSTIPAETLLVYIAGLLCCTAISIFHIINIHPDYFSSLDSVLDLCNAIIFAGLSILFIIRISRKLEVYNDRFIRKSILGNKVTFFKEINGHYIDDSSNSTLGFAKGYFRGVIIKKKDGSHFSLNKAELSHFSEIKKHIRSRCRYFNNNAIKKQINKEDRKLYLLLIIILVILIASLLH